MPIDSRGRKGNGAGRRPMADGPEIDIERSLGYS